jgi:hypothetical protein
MALHDQNSNVREAAAQALIKNMSPEEIDQSFIGKEHQRSTIKCAIREVLNSQIHQTFETKSYLNQILCLFEGGQYALQFPNKSNLYSMPAQMTTH